MKVSISEAAKAANVSVRTIWNWLKKYKLTRYSMRDVTLVELDEVQTVVDNDTRFTPTPQLLAVILRKIEKLQREVEFLMYANGRSTPIAEYNDQQVSLIYSMIKTQLSKQAYRTEDLAEIVSLLGTVSEEMFEILMGVTDDPHPWVPFMLLAKKIQGKLRDSPKFKTDLDYQLAYKKLSTYRNTIRDIALIFIEADTDNTSRSELIKQVGGATALESELVRRIIWQAERHPNALPDVTPANIEDELKGVIQDLLNQGRTKKSVPTIVSRIEGIIHAIKK